MGGEPKLDFLDRGDRDRAQAPLAAFTPRRADPNAPLEIAHRLPVARVVGQGAFDGADTAPPPAVADADRAKRAGIGAAALAAAVPVSLLPERWRQRAGAGLPLVSGTLLSGFAQLLLGVLLYVDGVIGMRVTAGASGFTTYSSSLDAYLGLLLSGYGALCVYLFAEGTLRFIGAAVLHEPHGTLPAWIAQVAYDHSRERWADLKLGRRVADRVVVAPPDCDLRIESCRPRDWDDDTAVEYEHRYYEVQQAVRADSGPHRFVYRLRRRPTGKILRRIHHYAPDELLPLQRRDK